MSISANALSSLHAERHHRGGAIRPGVERAGAGQRDDARQAVERADEIVVALLELGVHVLDRLLVAGERRERGLLRDGAGVRGALALDRATWR